VTLLGGILFIIFGFSTLYTELLNKTPALDSSKMPPGA
jgi:hypothetical protein